MKKGGGHRHRHGTLADRIGNSAAACPGLAGDDALGRDHRPTAPRTACACGRLGAGARPVGPATARPTRRGSCHERVPSVPGGPALRPGRRGRRALPAGPWRVAARARLTRAGVPTRCGDRSLPWLAAALPPHCRRRGGVFRRTRSQRQPSTRGGTSASISRQTRTFVMGRSKKRLRRSLSAPPVSPAVKRVPSRSVFRQL